MPRWSSISVAIVLAVFGLKAALAAESGTAIPDFSADRSAWVKTTNLWDDPPPGSGPGPLHSDPDHPFRMRGVDARGNDDSGTGRVGDWRDPNLKPRAAEQVKNWGDREAAGDVQLTASASCAPPGVPGIHMINEPLFIVQGVREVTMLWQRGPHVRHILLNVTHSRAPAPSWSGESIGRYDGDTLVVDTIAFKPGAQLDHFGVTNSAKLHVVERFTMVEGPRGKELQVVFQVDDPGTYYHPWSGMMRYRHVAATPAEMICAENNLDYFTGKLNSVPTAMAPDF